MHTRSGVVREDPSTKVPSKVWTLQAFNEGPLPGAGGCFSFECTAWWRVYIYYVWLCLGSREYWLLDLTLRE